ncbi:hypothetical protein [Aquimarina sp. 2201CG5-10]|uniref:hypothetical protein n=1 Tax=Aquimarina callyspongiae TaxID=3098150 RepID=UPI002AB40936|nr:hypothetical protein [Aquimarina sp. 2201CG5-10]MDY8138443.1 hypothetical protein [Aquimarina sp. 2201CG5-10]
MKKISLYSFVIIFIWIGFLIAISFMEAPLKFQADSVTTAIGVEIGKIVFKALNSIELLFSIFLLFTLKEMKRSDKKIFIGLLFLFVIVGVQSFYLLPVLDKYADIVIKGGSSPSNIPHIFYVILEVVKLFLLFYIGYRKLLLYRKNIVEQTIKNFEID